MQKNATAAVVPVHFPKIADFTRLVTSYREAEPDIDLYAVLSEDERVHELTYRGLVGPDNMIWVPAHAHNTSVITYKKFMGINYLSSYHSYEGFMTPDAETLFVNLPERELARRGGFYKSFRDTMARPTIYQHSDPTLHVGPSTVSCDYVKQTPEVLRMKQRFSWWNTLPWYRADDLPEFFDDIGYYKHLFIRHSPFAFDHLIYMSWLLANGEAEISSIQYYLESPSLMSPEEIGNLAYAKIDWLPYSWRDWPDFAAHTPLAYFHADRPRSHQ